MLVVVIKQLSRELTFVFILYFILPPNPMSFSPQNVPFKKKNLLEMCTLKKKEEGEREKKEEEESREGKVWKERGMTLEN